MPNSTKTATEKIRKEKIAILTIEYQKNWTNGGFFHSLIKKELAKNHVLKNSVSLLNECRKLNIPILHAPLIIDKNDKMRYRKVPILAKLFNQLTINTWKSAFTDGIYKKSDIVIEGRSSYDATIDSNLIEKLSQQGITTVVLAGFTTNHCVQMTYSTLSKKGFSCYIASQCTAALNDRIQKQVESTHRALSNPQILDMIAYTIPNEVI